MEIHIEQLKERPLKLAFVDAVEAFPLLCELVEQEEVAFRDEIRVELVAALAGALVEVEGTLWCTVVLPCSRCLQPVGQRIELPLLLTFSRQSLSDSVPDAELELSEIEVGLIPFEGDTIDLRTPVEQELLMALPQHPLCRDDCAGLCPACGADLNSQHCDCALPQFHGALAALKGFKVRPD